LLAAQGCLELGNHIGANAELDHIALENHAHPDVLEIRWEIYSREKRWSECVDIGNSIMTADPYRSIRWLHHSFALQVLNRAHTHLATVVDFPANWRVSYNPSASLVVWCL
jgi:hypothetical protein